MTYVIDSWVMYRPIVIKERSKRERGEWNGRDKKRRKGKGKGREGK